MRYLKKLALALVMVMSVAGFALTASAAGPSTQTKDITKATATVADAVYTGAGKVGHGAITVVLDGVTLKEGVDFDVISHEHDVVGTYTLKIVGKAPNFTGTKEVTWNLKMQEGVNNGPATVSLKSGANKVTYTKLTKDKVVKLSLKNSKGYKLKFEPKKSKYIKTNVKKGRIRLKKGIKAGTYKVKVSIVDSKGNVIGHKTLKFKVG